MSRQEDFFNEATKQIRDSYVFQSDGTYSDDDVRDIATSLAEYGYQYAIDKVCKHFMRIKECDYYVEQPVIEKACQYLYDWNKKQVEKHGSKAVLSIREFTISVSGFRKAMEE